MRVTEAERAELAQRAEAAGVSLPRLLVESALGSPGSTAPERRAWLSTFLAVRRTLAGAANNLNQLTRLGHIDQRVPDEVAHTAASVRRCAERLDELLENRPL